MDRFRQQIDICVEIRRRLGQQCVQAIDLGTGEPRTDHIPAPKIAVNNRATRQNSEISVAMIHDQPGEQVFQLIGMPFQNLNELATRKGQHARDVITRIIATSLGQNVSGA